MMDWVSISVCARRGTGAGLDWAPTNRYAGLEPRADDEHLSKFG